MRTNLPPIFVFLEEAGVDAAPHPREPLLSWLEQLPLTHLLQWPGICVPVSLVSAWPRWWPQNLSSTASVQPKNSGPTYSWVRQCWNLAKAYNSNSYETDLILKKGKKFVFLGFLVRRLWWFTFKALFLPYWCYVFPQSKDWDSSSTSDFRA